MKKKVNYLEAAVGMGIIAFTIGDTPAIPDEIIGVPLGLALVMDGMRWLK